MITTDKLLIELFNFGISKLDSKVPARDKKILSSLSRQIISGHFLTENQGKLLVKILKENLNYVSPVVAEKISLIENPVWSENFRVISQVRQISIKKGNIPEILIEFTYNKRLRQLVLDLNKQIDGQLSGINTKQYSLPLTEKNIFVVVSALKLFKFEIDPDIMKFYHEISEILKNADGMFDILELQDDKIINSVKKDIGVIDHSNLLLLNDRRFRYQYQIFSEIHEISLPALIAKRQSPKVWANSKNTNLDQLINALVDLNRLPILFIFNGHDAKETVENLKKMSEALEVNNINTDIGIYFRFDNSTEINKEFNNLVSSLKYNSRLEKQTKIVGISNNKLPKFMLTGNWRPNSVISFSNNFKNNKTSLYCDDVDLIIFYNNHQPFGEINAIV